jgi:hypothetical protein
MAEATNNQTVHQPFRWITVSSYILSILLFGLCVWFVFYTKSNDREALDKAIAYDSSITILKKDTVVTEAGKKTIINYSTTTSKISGVNPKAENDDMNIRLDTTFKYFILLFGVFILLTLLPRIKSFDISKDGVKADMYELAKAMNDSQNQQTQAATIPTGGKKLAEESIKAFQLEKIRLSETNNKNDPQKNLWGGSDVNKNRKITANISRITGSEWADILLRVESLDSVKYPLQGIVIFHLHPSFTNPNPVIIVINGIAELKLKAWGAFTVGAECDDKSTTLELDLANHPQAFEPFKSR